MVEGHIFHMRAFEIAMSFIQAPNQPCFICRGLDVTLEVGLAHGSA